MIHAQQKQVDAVSQAERLLAEGNPGAAAQLAAPVARNLPGYARAQTILARALRDLGDTATALARFKAAAEVSGKDTARWREYVTELLKAGQKGRARNAAQKAPLAPKERKALMELARAGLNRAPASGGVSEADLREVQEMIRSGRFEGARQRALDHLSVNPESAFLHNVLGVVALSANNLGEAEEHFRKVLSISPNFTGALANLGLALTLQNKPAEAIRILRSAVSADPDSIEAQANLANAYLAANLYNDAAAQARKLLDRTPDDPETLKLLSAALMKCGRYEDALSALWKLRDLPGEKVGTDGYILKALEASGREREALQFAREQMDKSPENLRRIGALLAQFGHLEEARETLRTAISRDPDLSEAYMNYGSLDRWRTDDPVLSALESHVGPEERPGWHGTALFALAKARMDTGRHADGFRLLRKANDEQSKVSPWDRAATEAEFQRITSIWTRGAIEDLQGVGEPGIAPIFVVGMPRSGSTLIEQIIAAHPDVTGIGEDSCVAAFFPTDMPAKRDTVAQAARDGLAAMSEVTRGGARLLDKFLNNFRIIGALSAAYPNAVFLQTVRDPRSVALSIFSNPMKVKGHPYSTNLENIGRYYVLYHDLMKHWHTILGNRLVRVGYEELVTDPEPAIRSLVSAVGLTWNDACLRPESVAKRVKTLSVAQVRSGIHSASVERWRRYETELQPFTNIIAEAGLIET